MTFDREFLFTVLACAGALCFAFVAAVALIVALGLSSMSGALP